MEIKTPEFPAYVVRRFARCGYERVEQLRDLPRETLLEALLIENEDISPNYADRLIAELSRIAGITVSCAQIGEMTRIFRRYGHKERASGTFRLPEVVAGRVNPKNRPRGRRVVFFPDAADNFDL